MPILDDILDHEVIGAAIRQGFKAGYEQGFRAGLEQALKRRQEAGQKLLKRLLQKPFGISPDWVQARLPNLPPDELDALALLVFDVAGLEDLFPDKS